LRVPAGTRIEEDIAGRFEACGSIMAGIVAEFEHVSLMVAYVGTLTLGSRPTKAINLSSAFVQT